MNNVFRIILLVLLGGMILFTAGGCFGSAHFERVGNSFYTMDKGQAQEQIPFPIIMPDYIAKDKGGSTPRVTLSGTLKEYQTGNRVELRLVYQVLYVGVLTNPYTICEYNYPVLPPSTANNTDISHIEIGGIRVVKVASQEPTISYYFNLEDIYYVVESQDSIDVEVYKMIESMTVN